MSIDSAIKFITSGSMATWILVVVLTVMMLAVVYLYVHAYRDGREVSFWPPRIGPAHGKGNPKQEELVSGTPIPSRPIWEMNSRVVDERADWARTARLVIGVQYSPKFFKDFFDVIQTRSEAGLATLALVLVPDGAAAKYLKESETGTAKVDEGVQEIERMAEEADAGRGYVRVKKHDRVMRYSFIRTDQSIWVKFFTNSAYRTIVPAVKIDRGSDLYAFFDEDIRQLELASHD